MITILLQKILEALTAYFTAVRTKLGIIKENLESMLVTTTATGDIVSFNSTIKYPLEALTVDLVEGETATVFHRGANLWDEVLEEGSINTATGQNESYGTERMRSKDYIAVCPGQTYYLVSKKNKICYLYMYGKDKTYISIYAAGAGQRNNTFTLPDNCYFIRFRTDNGYGTSYANDISINFPDTDTNYHAYEPSSADYDYPLIASDIVTMKGTNIFWSNNGPVTIEYLSKS